MKATTALVALSVLCLWACAPESSGGSADFDPQPSLEAGTEDAAVAAVSAEAGTATSGGAAFASLELDAALTQGRKEKKLVLVNVYTDWCGYCKKLDKEVFRDPDVKAAMQAFVAIKADAEGRGETAARRFGVRGFPTILFLDPDGREVRRIEGYVRRDDMLRILKTLPRPA